MYQLLSRKIKTVSPRVADEILKANIYDGQRSIRKKQIKILTDAITSGVFTVGHIAIAHQGWNGGDLMLVNGQHQCNAVINTGKSVEAVVEEYQCKTPEDFSLLYRQFDNNATRTLSDVALPEARALKLDWSKKFLTKFLTGIDFVEGWLSYNTTKNEKIEYLKKYIPEGNFVNKLMNERTAPEVKHIFRGIVIAVMIVTYKKSQSDAYIFWREVRDGENLPSSSASLKLRNYLMSTMCSFGRGVNAPSLNASASYHEMYSKCVNAWNAYRKNEPTRLKYFPDKDLPKAV